MISSLKNAGKILLIILVAVMVNCDLPYHKDIDAHVTLYLTINNNIDDTVAIKYSLPHWHNYDLDTIVFNSEVFSIEKQDSFHDTIEYKYTELIPCGFTSGLAKSLELYASVFVKDTLYGRFSVFPWDTTRGYLEDSEDCRKVTWDTLNIN